MISSFHGCNFPLDFLRNNTFAGRDGVSLLGISKAAEKIGFKSLGGRFTFEKLVEKAPLPCIAHWDQEHFVVIHKIEKKRNGYTIHVADPGKGLLSYPYDEFSSHWVSTISNKEEKGILLLLEPTNYFYEQAGQNSALSENKISFLGKYFLRHKKFFGQLFLGLFIGCLLQLIFPFLTQAVVDTGIGNRDIGFIWLLLIAQLMLLLGRTSIDFIRRRILLHISTRINISLISDFFIKLMKLPMAFFDTKLLGDLLQRIDDHNRIERFLTAQTLNLIFSLFSFIIFGIVLFIYSLKIFAIFIVGSILYGIWIFFFLERRRILDYKYFEQQATNRSKTYQLITGIQEIKLQSCEQRKRWEWEDTQANLFDVSLKSLSLQQTQEAGSICINEVKNILITVFAATAVIHGEMTLGMMLSTQYIIGQLNSPIEQMMNFIYQWQDVSISLERMGEIHTKKEEENENRIIAEIPLIWDKTIHIRNVDFQYEGPHSKKILNEINLDIPEGKITAIVGASGSGKTTLIKLLLGNYLPVAGSITIGDLPIEQINLTLWRMQCGAVMQDGFIFSESIARNIAVSDEEIDTEKLQWAAQIANIDGFITQLPLKYNTVVGQEGQGLSQGQKQRLLIARAVYKNPQFIFLDEATNALDANNERQIVENLEKFYQGKTVVVVAHRLSTVKNADQIVVLENGQIVEQGNHESLVQSKGKYYELVRNQLELGN
jgi:ATP-binding cassette subfamily B protein